MEKISSHFEEYLWPKIIEPTIKNALKNVDESFLQYVSLESLVDYEYQNQLCNVYERKREWLKRIYFGNVPTKDKCLDMHKIAAIICRSLIGCKPITFNVKKANDYKKEYAKDTDLEWIIDNYFINYKIAFNCALLISFYDLCEKIGFGNYSKKALINEVEIIHRLTNDSFGLYNNSLITSEHESFYKSIILNLAINDIQKRDFDYLGFATICFQLQQYEVLNKQMNIETTEVP